IVGLATARHLALHHRASVVVIEAEDRLAAHQTGNNSGVIHSGLYYRPGSLKAQNCTAGREELYRFAAEHDIPHHRCGKLVVATRDEELPALEELERRGRANGLRGMKRLGPEQIREREPQISGVAGLEVRETGIIDYPAVCHALAATLEEQGGEIRLGARLRDYREEGTGLVLETTGGDLPARGLVNCAGLQCDRVARLCGAEPGLRIVPFRGEYYEIVPERRSLVRHLIYPVPDPRFPFLGVHFTRMIDGTVEAGPNAVLALRREGYRRGAFSPRDIASFLFYRGFWRLSGRYWRVGLGEVWRSWSKRAFVKALRHLMPELKLSDVRRGGAGVRAQALEPSGAMVDDFRIVESGRGIHVLNAPSPAATASLAIGRTVAERAARRFDL
ncbi:MAG: L-2-hydroxyglutarate oxidase, partial [Deltaproteobacteria bacterium]|nr:L-2-hydroxyglutarate oxidase [Deltaproteobacteria bacterium]